MTTDLQKVFEDSSSYATDFDGKPTGVFDKDNGGMYKDPNIQEEFDHFTHGWFTRKDLDMQMCSETIGAATNEDLAEMCFYNIKAI